MSSSRLSPNLPISLPLVFSTFHKHREQASHSFTYYSFSHFLTQRSMNLLSTSSWSLPSHFSLPSNLSSILLYSTASILTLLALAFFVPSIRSALVFAYTCFLQPIGKVANQSERLDKFYQNQATGESLQSSKSCFRQRRGRNGTWEAFLNSYQSYLSVVWICLPDNGENLEQIPRNRSAWGRWKHTF